MTCELRRENLVLLLHVEQVQIDGQGDALRDDIEADDRPDQPPWNDSKLAPESEVFLAAAQANQLHAFAPSAPGHGIARINWHSIHFRFLFANLQLCSPVRICSGLQLLSGSPFLSRTTAPAARIAGTAHHNMNPSSQSGLGSPVCSPTQANPRQTHGAVATPSPQDAAVMAHRSPRLGARSRNSAARKCTRSCVRLASPRGSSMPLVRNDAIARLMFSAASAQAAHSRRWLESQSRSALVSPATRSCVISRSA